MVSMAENQIPIDEEQDRENSPPATTPVSERPTQTPLPCSDEKSPSQDKNWDCSRFCS